MSVKFKQFSKKQLQVLTWWANPVISQKYNAVIADGSIRSGKTMSMSLSFVLWAMSNFNECNFAICGKTVGSCRRNVITPLIGMIRQRYRIKDKRSDNVITIESGNIKNSFYIFGGKDESSQDLIQGITLAGVLLDEVALMPQSFVNQATGRCSVEGARFWFNCNPDTPYHWFYQNWIKKADEKKALHLHFTMDDNLTLSEEIKKRYQSMYSGTFYERYILGLWVAAEGLIYKLFADDFRNEKRMMITQKPDLSRIVIGVDFGGSSSAHSFVATGTDRGFNNFYALLSERVRCKDDNGNQIEINPNKLGELFCEFVYRVIAVYGTVNIVYCDSAEQTLILGLRSTAKKKGLGWLRIENALKTTINDRIRCICRLQAQGRFKYMEYGCESLCNALSTAVWNPKILIKDERLDDGTSDIDTLDAFEYTFERDITKFIRYE